MIESSASELTQAYMAHNRFFVRPIHYANNGSNCGRIANVCRMRDVCEKPRIEQYSRGYPRSRSPCDKPKQALISLICSVGNILLEVFYVQRLCVLLGSQCAVCAGHVAASASLPGANNKKNRIFPPIRTTTCCEGGSSHRPTFAILSMCGPRMYIESLSTTRRSLNLQTHEIRL